MSKAKNQYVGEKVKMTKKLTKRLDRMESQLKKGHWIDDVQMSKEAQQSVSDALDALAVEYFRSL